MAGINFVDRKNGKQFDAGFYLHNGKTLGDLSSWHVGDHVSVCFPDQGDRIKLIRENAPYTANFYASGDFLQVQCKVVRRWHSVVWRAVGKFEPLSTCDVTLEAKDGFWEDVLAWVIVGKQPNWIEIEDTPDSTENSSRPE